MSFLAAILAFALVAPQHAEHPAPPVASPAPHRARVDVRTDERRREIIGTIGPFRVAPSMPMHPMDMMMMQHAESLVGVFSWPETRLFHGVKLAVVDGQGGGLPRRLLHHTYMVNVDRRQLVHEIMERTFSFGQETEDLATPASIGMPMGRGQRMGIVIMWDNETGREVEDAYVRYTFALNPRRQSPAPTPVMPFFVDAHIAIGGADTFSVAPGDRTVAFDFTVATSGRLIAAGGHLHDHALRLQLRHVRTGRTLVTVTARRDSAGNVLSVSRELPGLWGRGPHLKAGERYRLVLEYDNPTADTLFGSMGMMGGLFVPDRPSEWPRVDTTNADWLADLRGMAGAELLLASRRSM